MASLESGLYELGRLDQLAEQDSAVHRLDPRAKLLATLVFIVCVVSFDRYAVASLVPFVVFPIVLAELGGLPLGLIGKRVLIASPFAFAIGMFNPLLDRAVVAHVGGLAISGGWLSFASILERFGLTVAAALVLVATTGLVGICAAMERLGAPSVFTTQLMFLYRYIFVLAEEGMRLARARSLRTFGKRGMGMRVYGQMLGHLLLRTYGRAQRVYGAMLCRGFDGRVRTMRRLRFAPADWAFLLGWSALFVFFRLVNVPEIVGLAITGLIS